MMERYSEERRNFLKTIVALGGGAAAALSMGKTANAAGKTVSVASDVSRKTYTETDHIRKYYQTARG